MAKSDQVPVNSKFHRKSTGQEVLADIDLSGKIAIVTGGYSGIGLETTRALANKGVKVIVPARSMEKAAKNLPNTMADEPTGDVIRSSKVRLERSSANRRMVRNGTKKTNIQSPVLKMGTKMLSLKLSCERICGVFSATAISAAR